MSRVEYELNSTTLVESFLASCTTGVAVMLYQDGVPGSDCSGGRRSFSQIAQMQRLSCSCVGIMGQGIVRFTP